MEEPRLTAALFVSMALRMASLGGRYGVVARRGDAEAGGILLLLRSRAGCAVLSQMRAGDGAAAWLRATGAAPVEEAAAAAYVERQVRIDPDLWVVEIDGPDLEPPFDARVLS